MSNEIVVAIIGGLATILAAIIALFKKRKSDAESEKSDSCNDNNVNGNQNISVVGAQNTVNVHSEPEAKKSILSIVSLAEDSKSVLKVRGEEKNSFRTGYSMINIRIINKGTLDAALTKMSIYIDDYIVNRTPHFKFSMEVVNSRLCIYAMNNGWGVAEDFTFELSLEGISGLVDKRLLTTTVHSIESNQRALIFELAASNFDESALKDYAQRIVQGSLIPIDAKIIYGNRYKRPLHTQGVSMGDNTIIMLSVDGSPRFCSQLFGVAYELAAPDTIYASVIEEGTHQKEYNISRVVPVGGIDDFDIFFTSKKSCSFSAVLVLSFNGEEEIKSNLIRINIQTYTDYEHLDSCIDGCRISTESFEKRDYLDDSFSL